MNNEDLKEYIRSKSDYLENNDLVGLYAKMATEVYYGHIMPVDVGRVTWTLEKCGIDTVESLISHIIPAYFSYGMVSPDTLLSQPPTNIVEKRDDNIPYMFFPYHIDRIGDYAFAYSRLNSRDSTRTVDLRGIRHVGDNAFYASPFNYVIIDNKLSHVGNNAFAGSHLINIYTPKVPKGKEEERAHEVLEMFNFDSDDVDVKFY